MICVGVVTGARGLAGVVRIKSFTAEPRSIGAYGPLEDEDGRRFRLRVVGEAKGQVFARIDGILDRAAAETLKGVRLFVARTALPEAGEDEFYQADLVGLAVSAPDGTMIGTVLAVGDFGAGAVLEVGRASGPPVLVPFTRAVVPEVDLAAGRIVLDMPPGLLDEG